MREPTMADIAARLGVSHQLVSIARQDPEKMGIAAIQAAIRRIDQPALPSSVSVVEPWLVVRGSTSRPSAG